MTSAFGIEHGEIEKAQLGPVRVQWNTRGAQNRRLRASNAARSAASNRKAAQVGAQVRHTVKVAGGKIKAIPDMTVREAVQEVGKPAAALGAVASRHPAATGAAMLGTGLAAGIYGSKKYGEHQARR